MAEAARTGVPEDTLRTLEVIARRRSIGVVERAPVARELIDALLVAAAAAPNHRHTQPWRFVVLEGAARRRLGAAHARAAASASGGPLDEEREIGKLERAPVVIVCVCVTDPSDPVRSIEDRDAVAAGVENMLLAAEALGLGAMWRTGSMPREAEVRAELGLGEDAEIVAFVYVGWPKAGQRPAAPDRRPLTEIVEWRSS